jgi:DNA-binding NarL/FixJ family response regulator
MKPKQNYPTHPEHATLRFTVEVERIPGDRLARIALELRRAAGDGVIVTGVFVEPVAVALQGPRAALEALRAKPVSEAMVAALDGIKAGFGSLSSPLRPRRERRVLLVDGDLARGRADAEVLGHSRIDACVVDGIAAAELMLLRSGLVFDAIVLGHVLADGEGLELLDRVPERDCSVLVVDERVRPEVAREYRKRVVHRYVPRPANLLQLVSRVNATVLDTLAWRQVEHPSTEEPDEPPRLLVDPEHGADRLKHVCRLNPVEREVALMVLLGMRDLEIAEKLSQSERTAKRYVGKVLEKAGIQNRASLWGVLHQDGLGTLPPREPERPTAAPPHPPVARPSGPVGQPPSRPPVPSSVPTWPTV